VMWLHLRKELFLDRLLELLTSKHRIFFKEYLFVGYFTNIRVILKFKIETTNIVGSIAQD